MMLNKYIKNNQLSNIIYLGLGTIIAQSINLIIQPILTRIVTPEDIGIYNFVISIANLLIPIASFKLTLLIVIEKNDEDAEILTDVSIITAILVTLFSIFFLIILMLLGNNIFSEIGYINFLIPIIIITNALRFIFISHNNRYRKYSLIAKLDIYREMIKGVTQILLGKILGSIGLLIGYAISPLFGLKFQSKDYRVLFNNRRISVEKVLSTYRKYKNHIIYMVPSQFINTFSYTLINISVISLFTPKEAGYYSISFMVLGLPLVLISNNVSRVYLQNLRSLSMERKSIWNSYIIFVGVLSILSFVGFTILAIIAPNLTEFVFGNGYGESGKYITIMCFMFALRFVATSISDSYVFFNKQKTYTIFQLLLVFSGFIVYLLTVLMKFNIYEYLTLISLFYGIVYFMMVINLGFISKKYEYLSRK